jgi:hypothetical protein
MIDNESVAHGSVCRSPVTETVSEMERIMDINTNDGFHWAAGFLYFLSHLFTQLFACPLSCFTPNEVNN